MTVGIGWPSGVGAGQIFLPQPVMYAEQSPDPGGGVVIVSVLFEIRNATPYTFTGLPINNNTVGDRAEIGIWIDWPWLNPGVDPPVCIGDPLTFRCTFTFSDSSTDDSGWLSATFQGQNPFGASGGHDPMLDTILAAVTKTY